MRQISPQSHIPRWIITTMTSLSSINKVMTKINCLSCRQVSNSSRMEIIHSRETSERSQRVCMNWTHLIICSQVLVRIMLSSFTWWISSLLVMQDKSRHLLASSKSWTQVRKPCSTCNSNKAQLRTSRRCHNNSILLWAQTTPRTWQTNLHITVLTLNSTTLQAELHIKTSSKCYNKCNYKICTCSNSNTLNSSYKTLEVLLRCNKPFSIIKGSNTFLNP